MVKLYNLGLTPSLLYLARLRITLLDGSKKLFLSLEDGSKLVEDYQHA